MTHITKMNVCTILGTYFNNWSK